VLHHACRSDMFTGSRRGYDVGYIVSHEVSSIEQRRTRRIWKVPKPYCKAIWVGALGALHGRARVLETSCFISWAHITSHALQSMHNRRYSKERCRQPWRLHSRFNIQRHGVAAVLHALADVPTTSSAAAASVIKNALEVSSIGERPRT